MKRCSKCKETKEVGEFNVDNKNKDKLNCSCKECRKKSQKRYMKNGGDIKQKIYRRENKEKNRERASNWYDKNKEKASERGKLKYKENPDKYKKKSKKWVDDNPEKSKKYAREYISKKYKENLIFRLHMSASCLIRNSMRAGGYKKNSRTYEYLCCPDIVFFNHLNDNKYGFKYGDEGLDLDHIIPRSSADTEEDAVKLNHYTNFQLLPREYNQHVKRAKPWDQKHFEEWLNKQKEC